MIASPDIQNVHALAEQFNHPANAISQFVAGKLSDQTRQLLATSTDDEKLKQALAGDLNGLARGPVIYDPQRFIDVTLNPTTKDLVEKWNGNQLKENGLILLNRALLEDSYPREINKDLVPYWFFLVALFIVGLGFAMLQIAANPYVTILGPERTASSRLNLAQAFNSVGTTAGPLIGGYLIFEYFARTGVSGADSVKVPYLAFCIVFTLLAAIFFFIHLPHVGEGKIEASAGALKYPHVVLGIIAIFMYVGGEVSVGSSIINFLGQPDVAGMSAIDASKYVSLFWGGMLVGRFMAAVELSEMKPLNKQLGLVLIPVLCFLLFWTLRSWNSDLKHFDFAAGWVIVKNYLPLLALCWLLFQFGKALAGRTLFIFSGTIVVLLLVAIMSGSHYGKLAMWCIVGIGLFTSIGWPNIFSLALDGTGIYKSQVSSLLVMAILGGALLPPIQGHIADLGGLRISYIVPLIAYAYVGFYGLIGHRVGRGRLPSAT